MRTSTCEFSNVDKIFLREYLGYFSKCDFTINLRWKNFVRKTWQIMRVQELMISILSNSSKISSDKKSWSMIPIGIINHSNTYRSYSDMAYQNFIEKSITIDYIFLFLTVAKNLNDGVSLKFTIDWENYIFNSS